MMETVLIKKHQGRILDERDETISMRYKLNDIFCTAWLSHAISAIVKHNIPDILPDKLTNQSQAQPLSISEIAQKSGLNAQALYRALRALAANGIFIEEPIGYFVHNEASLLLRDDHSFSWRGMALMWNHPSCLKAWGECAESLKDGRSGIEHAFGKPLYEHLHDYPEATKAFADAMISNSAHAAQAIAQAFPFDHYKSIVDLGGGVGTLLATILARWPNLSGVLLEIADLKVAAEDYLHQCGLCQRAKFQVGNFLEHIPTGNDLYLIKNSLWNWNDDHCLAIIKNVRKAIGSAMEQRFIIVEYIIDAENAAWTTLYDLQILNMPGGRARTLLEYKELLNQAEFSVESIAYAEDQTLLIAKPK